MDIYWQCQQFIPDRGLHFLVSTAPWVPKAQKPLVSNPTAPDGLLHTTICEGSIGNCLEKGWNLEKMLDRWLDKSFVYHRLSQTDFNQSDQQTIWLAEPFGESNSYWSLSKEERQHLFHQEKPSGTSFSFLSMMRYSAALIKLIL